MFRPLALALFAAGLLAADPAAAPAPKPIGTPDCPASACKAYPLTTCLITGRDITKSDAVICHQGQEFRLCCKGCIPTFKADPAKYVKLLAEKCPAGSTTAAAVTATAAKPASAGCCAPQAPETR